MKEVTLYVHVSECRKVNNHVASLKLSISGARGFNFNWLLDWQSAVVIASWDGNELPRAKRFVVADAAARQGWGMSVRDEFKKIEENFYKKIVQGVKSPSA